MASSNPLRSVERLDRERAKVGWTVDSLRSDVREWRSGVAAKGVLPLTVAIAGLAFVVSYGVGSLARTYVRSTDLIPGRLTFRPLEHGLMLPFPVLLLMYVFVAVALFGVTPVASARFRWWTRRRWALVTSIAIGSGGALSNFTELLQKGSITDFLLIHNLGDFSGGDFLIIIGGAGALVLSVSPDYARVRKGHIVFAIGVVVFSLIALPLIRSPLNHLLPLALLVAGLAWLAGYFLWRVSVGNRLLGTLAQDVPRDPSPETDRVLEAIELALQNSTHIDLAASARALAKLSYAYRRLGRLEDLRRTADTYLRIAEEVNHIRMKAWALDYIGFAYSLGHDPAQAYRAWQESLRLANQQGDDRHRLLLLANVAWAEVELDRKDDAQRTYASALDLAERLGNSEMTSRLRQALSLIRASDLEAPANNS